MDPDAPGDTPAPVPDDPTEEEARRAFLDRMSDEAATVAAIWQYQATHDGRTPIEDMARRDPPWDERLAGLGLFGSKAYIALVPIQSGDRRYEIGETICLEAQDAEPLLAANAIVAPARKPNRRE